MWYLWKKEFLESVGKNWKDTRWLDRAIDKGVVYHDRDRGYILCVEYIDELIKMSTNKVVPVENDLEKKVEEQDNTIKLLMKDNVRLTKEKVELEEKLPSVGDAAETKANLEYYKDKFKRAKRGYELCVSETYKIISRYQKISKDDYEEQLVDAIHEQIENEFGRED